MSDIKRVQILNNKDILTYTNGGIKEVFFYLDKNDKPQFLQHQNMDIKTQIRKEYKKVK